MIKLTLEQKQALKRLYLRQLGEDNPLFNSYTQLRRAVVPSFDCVMINMGYCWLGIEADGYTHS